MRQNVRYDDIICRYQNPQQIGEGGQKIVFSVMDETRGACVLKIGHYRTNSTMERILREVSILQSLDSPYFPKCYSLKRYDNQRFAILEEKLPGVPLSEKITEFQNLNRALRLSIELTNALSLLWLKRIIHRDIKPENILIGDGDRVFVIDLGIARLLDEISLTQTLAERGPCTPVYAAPEQLLNKKHEINHRSDQFAIGIVMAQLLLDGRHPFDPQVVEEGEGIVDNILQGKWASRKLQALIPQNVVQVIKMLLANQPYERFRTPEMLKEALYSLVEEGK